MKYLITRKEHFKNERLSKNLKTTTIGTYDKLLGINTLNEILDSNLKTDYNIETDNEISFYTNSGKKYRLDIIPKSEHGQIINHISFSEYDVKLENYDKLTGNDEMIELLNRIKYIINDLVQTNKIENRFCIGGTELESKNKIYEYSLYILLGKNGYEKKDTIFYDVGWGLYFTI
jgi:hypothetical protein